MITDPSLVVARLKLPMLLDAAAKATRAIADAYPDDELVIITDGPLWEAETMVIARKPPVFEAG